MPWRIFRPSVEEGPDIAAAWPNTIRSAVTPISSAFAGAASSNRQHKALSCIWFIEALLRDKIARLGEMLPEPNEELANSAVPSRFRAIFRGESGLKALACQVVPGSSPLLCGIR